MPGRAVFLEQGCAPCHGPAGQGTRTAPSLAGLEQHWTPAALEAFLLDPQASRAASPRLRALDERYLVAMPAVSGVSQAELEALVAYLLSAGADMS
jgi:mono/diheme cytochrome c family protein